MHFPLFGLSYIIIYLIILFKRNFANNWKKS